MHHIRSAADQAIAAGSSKTFLILGIITIVGATVGVIAIALGLGLGFGLTNNYSVPTTPLLNPPIVTCDTSARCGCQTVKPVFTPRIISGQTAVTNSWPWMAYLVMNNTRICSGFLISQQHILTTRSCLVPFGYNVTVTLGVNNFQFTLGGINISNTSVVSGPDMGELAVVTLGLNVTFNATVQPCCLSSSSTLPIIDTPGVIAGWGETSTTSIGIVSRNLQQAVVQIRNPSTCGTQVNNETICASFGSISTCPIDSGGPLMVAYGNAWTCVGIIDGRASNCNNPIPFIRISTYAERIQNITRVTFNN